MKSARRSTNQRNENPKCKWCDADCGAIGKTTAESESRNNFSASDSHYTIKTEIRLATETVPITLNFARVSCRILWQTFGHPHHSNHTTGVPQTARIVLKPTLMEGCVLRTRAAADGHMMQNKCQRFRQILTATLQRPRSRIKGHQQFYAFRSQRYVA